MAENEVKNEKVKVHISIWFIIFLVYLIFSLAYIFNLNQQIEAKNIEIASLTTKMESNIELSNSRTNAIIVQLENIIKDLKASTTVEDDTPIVTPSVEVSIGTYNASSDAMQVALTLSENNIASFTIIDGSGDSIVNGTYSVTDGTVVFTSDDGVTTHTFTVNEDGSLKLVINDVELTLSK